MIRARSLFLVPAVSIILLVLIPLVNVTLLPLILIVWYYTKKKQIHSYFRGVNYEQDELSEENRKKYL